MARLQERKAGNLAQITEEWDIEANDVMTGGFQGRTVCTYLSRAFESPYRVGNPPPEASSTLPLVEIEGVGPPL